MKATVVVLSIAFAILGIVGVAAQTTLWLSWLVLIGGVLGTIASFALPSTTRGGPAYIALLEGIGAGVLWLIAVVTRHYQWMAWWTFAFAIAFFVVAAVEYGTRRTGIHVPA